MKDDDLADGERDVHDDDALEEDEHAANYAAKYRFGVRPFATYSELARAWGRPRASTRLRLLKLAEADGGDWLISQLGKHPLVNVAKLYARHPNMAPPPPDLWERVEELEDGMRAMMAQIALLNDFRRWAEARLGGAGGGSAGSTGEGATGFVPGLRAHAEGDSDG